MWLGVWGISNVLFGFASNLELDFEGINNCLPNINYKYYMWKPQLTQSFNVHYNIIKVICGSLGAVPVGIVCYCFTPSLSQFIDFIFGLFEGCIDSFIAFLANIKQIINQILPKLFKIANDIYSSSKDTTYNIFD